MRLSSRYIAPCMDFKYEPLQWEVEWSGEQIREQPWWLALVVSVTGSIDVWDL